MAVHGVLAIALDRDAQQAGLDDLLRRAANDPDVRVVLLCLATESVEPAMPATLLRDLPQPVVAMVTGTCDAAAMTLLAACDIVLAAVDARFKVGAQETIDAAEAERRGLVTLSFAADDLERETETLARELAAKDPLALRFTKQTLRSVGALDWDEVLAFNVAKVAELQALRAGKPSPQDLAVQSFLAGKSKPGLGT